MQFFMLPWNYVPLQFALVACSLGLQYIYRGRLLCYRAVGKVFPSIKEMGNMLIENAGIALEAIKVSLFENH
jgi:hypothetical protein